MISVSIVTYNTSWEDLSVVLKSLDHSASEYRIYIVDNSPTDSLKTDVFNIKILEYIHNPSNPGFGAAHNIAIKKAIDKGAKYHFVVNPDVSFSEDVITPMVEYMEENPNVGMMMPQIMNDDGSIQNLPKLLPSPYSVLMRKFKRPAFLYEDFIKEYELRDSPKNLIYNAPILSGCFTLFRISALKEIGLYDDRFFMYFEDWDISRRMHERYKTIYFPNVSVIHGYESGANKSKRLFKIFVNSAASYFTKWGWFFDSKRRMINKKTLEQFK